MQSLTQDQKISVTVIKFLSMRAGGEIGENILLAIYGIPTIVIVCVATLNPTPLLSYAIFYCFAMITIEESKQCYM